MNLDTKFESLSFKPFFVNEVRNLNPKLDSGVNFFKNISSFDTK